MMNSFEEFLRWEEADRDTIKVKRLYIDIAEDIVAGLLLSQIVYWYLPSKQGMTKLRVRKDGHYWLAKGRNDWWDECRITARQFDRAIAILIEKGIVEKKTFKFNGVPTVHIRLIPEKLLDCVNSILRNGENGVTSDEEDQREIHFNENVKSTSPIGEIHLTDSVKTLTEITTENTTETTKDWCSQSSHNGKEETQALQEGDTVLPISRKKRGTPAVFEKPSKFVRPESQPRKEKNLDVVAEAIQRMTSDGRKRRTSKKPVRNANSIIAYFQEESKRVFGGCVPFETGKDKKLLKTMIDEMGYDTVVEMMNWMFNNWAKFSRECKLKPGLPTIGLFWGFRAYLLEKVLNKAGDKVVEGGKDENSF